MSLMTIGQVAKQTGIGVETVRFYERQGLIPEPSRTASGYRQYSADVIARIEFIKRGKALGFTLQEIRELFSLRVDSGCSCSDVKSRTVAKIEDVEGKLRELNQIKDALVTLAAKCSGRGPTSECPILDALDNTNTEGSGSPAHLAHASASLRFHLFSRSDSPRAPTLFSGARVSQVLLAEGERSGSARRSSSLHSLHRMPLDRNS